MSGLRLLAKKLSHTRTVRSAADDGAFSLDIVEAVIDGSLQSAAKGMLRYGMLEGNIGYIYFSNFTKNVESGFFKPSQPWRTRTA